MEEVLREVRRRAGGWIGFILGVKGLAEYPRGERPNIIGIEAPVSRLLVD